MLWGNLLIIIIIIRRSSLCWAYCSPWCCPVCTVIRWASQVGFTGCCSSLQWTKKCPDKSNVVFKGPVQFSFLIPNGATATGTGCNWCLILSNCNWTDANQSLSVQLQLSGCNWSFWGMGIFFHVQKKDRAEGPRVSMFFNSIKLDIYCNYILLEMGIVPIPHRFEPATALRALLLSLTTFLFLTTFLLLTTFLPHLFEKISHINVQWHPSRVAGVPGKYRNYMFLTVNQRSHRSERREC